MRSHESGLICCFELTGWFVRIGATAAMEIYYIYNSFHGRKSMSMPNFVPYDGSGHIKKVKTTCTQWLPTIFTKQVHHLKSFRYPSILKYLFSLKVSMINDVVSTGK